VERESVSARTKAVRLVPADSPDRRYNRHEVVWAMNRARAQGVIMGIAGTLILMVLIGGSIVALIGVPS
jgi:hypothetical protein